METNAVTVTTTT